MLLKCCYHITLILNEYRNNNVDYNGHYPKLPYSIPYNWVWVPHNNIINIIGGAQPPKSQFREYFSDGYIRLYQIRDYGESPLPVYIPIETATKQTKKGDILLARYGASLGKVFRAEAGAYNVAMAKASVKFFNLIDENYLFFLFIKHLSRKNTIYFKNRSSRIQ